MARRWTRRSPPRHTTSSWHKCLTRRRCWKLHTTRALAGIPDGAAKAGGISVGQASAAANMLRRRRRRVRECGAAGLCSSIRTRGLSVHAAFQLRRAARLGSREAVRHRAPRAPGTRARPSVRPAVRARPRVREGHRQDRQPDPHRGAIGDRAVLVRGLPARLEPDREYGRSASSDWTTGRRRACSRWSTSRSRTATSPASKPSITFVSGGPRRLSVRRRPTAIV